MTSSISINTLNSKVDLHEQEIKSIKKSLIPNKSRSQIRFGTYNIELKKSLIKPDFRLKTVLTDSTWDYVLSYLIRSSNKEAVFYWEQARNFYDASLLLDIISTPLTTYYCFLNATKALLKSKGVSFDIKHGVSGERKNGHYILQNEIIALHPKGVVSGLCTYLKEPVSTREEYNLKDVLYNLPFIHRAYVLTYKNSAELYIPVFNPKFVYDKDRSKGWFQLQLEDCYSNKKTENKIIGYNKDRYYENIRNYTLRRNKTFDWETTSNKPNEKSMTSFRNYYKKIRLDMLYIYSPNELWYIKRKDLSTERKINRNTMVLTLVAMHRLSELSRYEPQILKKHLEKDQSWLLREFINKSLLQFVDNISSEITGVDFRQTGFRT